MRDLETQYPPHPICNPSPQKRVVVIHVAFRYTSKTFFFAWYDFRIKTSKCKHQKNFHQMSVLLLNKKCNVKIFCIASASRYAKKYFQTVQNKHLNASDNSVEISYFVKFKACPYKVINMHHETLNEYSYHYFCFGKSYILHLYSHVISSENLFSPSHFKNAKQRSVTHWRHSLKKCFGVLRVNYQA